MNPKRDYLLPICWFFLVLYPFQYIWQGLRVSDEGNAMTSYQQIFSHPESIADTFGSWGTSVIGGLWLAAFEDLGLVGIRVGGILMSFLTVLFVYLLYRNHIERKKLLWSLFGSFIFCFHFANYIGIHYYGTSILFYCISIFLLAEGLKKRNGPLLFLAGFLITFNVFVRLPNLMGFLLVLAIPFYSHLKCSDYKKSARQLLWFAGGSVLSLFAVCCVMMQLGHLQHYADAIRYLFISATSSDAASNHGNLTGKVLRDFFDISRTSLLVAALLSVCVAIWQVTMRHHKRLAIAIPWIFFAIFALSGLTGRPLMGSAITFLIGMCFLVLGLRSIKPNSDKDLSLISFLIFVLLGIIPLGSGGGYHSYMMYPLLIALPLVLHYIQEISAIKTEATLRICDYTKKIAFIFDEQDFCKIKNFLFLFLIVFGFANNISYIDGELENRSQLTSSINHPLLRGIHTTKKKAEPLNQLIEQLPRYVHPGDPMLVAWISPIIYYISKAHPYIPHPWTEVYLANPMREFLLNGPSRGPLPVVIRENCKEKHRHDDILAEFYKKYGYTKKWGNEFYEIYTPF